MHLIQIHSKIAIHPNASGCRLSGALVVSALRNLARIGDEKVSRVVFTPNSCFAWLITFVDWCLGTSPAIYMSSGSLVNPEPDPRVTIILPTSPKPSDGIDIELFTTSGSLYNTIRIHHAVDDDGKPLAFIGMVRMHTHAEQTLQAMKADDGLGLRAVMLSLSYAIPEASTLLMPSSTTFRGKQLTRKAYPSLAKLFPDQSRIQKVLKTYFGPYAENFPGFQRLPPGSYGKLALRIGATALAL